MHARNSGALGMMLAYLALAGCDESESGSAPVDTTILEPAAAMNSNSIEPETKAVGLPAALKNALIPSCYRLDSCGYWKILSVSTEGQKDGVRLLRASLEYGEVENATGTSDDEKRIEWSKTADIMYALCSKSSPVIAWADGRKYLAEEFDFAGDGISGVQANNAMIYQALCHGLTDGQLSETASSLGYQPLPDGGRGQFEIDSPKQLLFDR